ncbi:hypothetical protein BWI96_05310 [Siphonobacter sp. SORGH_AS_0500]|nr:hypothetical protein [Siphonobacter sp. SORGH_AS_1065]PKK37877.1 hypothetical protein BWI96_05310 [Siphonobacter sp. SORGH_AS_0500]
MNVVWKIKKTMETAIIILLFLGALAYMGNQFRKQFSLRKSGGCAKGCGSCGVTKFEDIHVEALPKK